jgi:hypothetical protein
MSLNTSMPYYRNTSRETKTVREILQHEGIKSARLTSRDKKQNTSISDCKYSCPIVLSSESQQTQSQLQFL